MTLSQRLIWARQQAGLSISQSARLAGIDKTLLTALETDAVPDTHTMLLQVLAAQYDVDAAWLMTGQERLVSLPPTPNLSGEDRESLTRLLARRYQR